MSKATKRKHVVQEVMNDYVLPSGEQEIVRVLASKGNNLHEVETPKDERYLVSMPSRFRKNIWIKRGDFVLVQPIEEGNKVRAEIVSILYKDQIKYIKQEGKWPAEFEEQKKDEKMDEDLLPPSDDSDIENYSDLIVNTNRARVTYCESEDSSEDDDNETVSETVSDSKR